MGYEADAARDFAGQAANQSGSDDVAGAVGEGLAAIAFALLDLARSIREKE